MNHQVLGSGKESCHERYWKCWHMPWSNVSNISINTYSSTRVPAPYGPQVCDIRPLIQISTQHPGSAERPVPHALVMDAGLAPVIEMFVNLCPMSVRCQYTHVKT